MRESKYVIGDIAATYGIQTNIAVVFPDTIGHDKIGRSVFVADSIKSAGFCYINDKGRVSVYGQSVSLGVTAHHGVDEKIIEKALAIRGDS